jgi:arylsulfatase
LSVVARPDQTALLMNGEGRSCRSFMAHYSSGTLGAIRYDKFKVHITEGHGGLPGIEFYNGVRYPGEKYGHLYPGTVYGSPRSSRPRSHMGRIQ